jgi:hypothetical protein
MATQPVFSSLCACVHTCRLPHAFHIGQLFSGFSGISNTHSVLGFSIPLLHRLLLLTFPMLILRVVGLIKKNTSSTCHFLESSLVCWSARKQSSVAQSTTESEYIAATGCYSQILWIVHTMIDYGVIYKSVRLMCDKSSAICLAQHPIFHRRAKRIKVRHHFLRDRIEKGDIVIKYIDTERQLADIFTKPLNASRFTAFWGDLMFDIPMTWFEGGACAISCIYSIFFSSYCISSYLPKLSIASPVILACIWLIMLIIMLG